MKRTIFLYSGEGTQGQKTPLGLLKQSRLWPRIESVLSTSANLDLEQLWAQEAGRHRCPYSPLLTVTSQICLADLWERWGYRAEVHLGHSTGELAAAYQAGLYSLQEVLELALRIGKAAAHLEGQMIHGRLSDEELADLTVNASSLNFRQDDRTHVTVSGTAEELSEFLQQHDAFVEMQLPHPWHHPDYDRYAYQLGDLPSREVEPGHFVSGVTTGFETRLAEDHWRRWLVEPIDFIRAVEAIRQRYDDDHLEIIEIGFHPVLAKCCEVFRSYTYVSSMSRDTDDVQWIISERRKLDPRSFTETVLTAVHALKPELSADAALAGQGLNSLDMVELTAVLKPYFPGLSPQDLFRHTSLGLLMEQFGAAVEVAAERPASPRDASVVISGMSCRFPASVQTVPQFWDMLLSQRDQVREAPDRGGTEAGYLDGEVSRFDHEFFGISAAEASTMDPQQILALELTEMLWRDAGIDPQNLDRKRVGVYLGVWNQEYRGDTGSVYNPTGTNPSIIASRISYHYDLRGPSWVSNTACSSSLVAVHYAAKDIEAGRVDYAIVGGVNMLLDEGFSSNMRSSGFLSPDDRCKSFDDSANGYVRAEGGGLLLLTSKSRADRYYAELTGSATNQNGGRAQVITAPHPEAQEEVIRDACHDASISPQDLTYLECHGTGTKIGDPIEASAIRNTVARDRPDPVYLGSVKSNIGHLESASGIAGLIKSVAMLNRGVMPPNLHFNLPNSYIDFDTHPLVVVTEASPIDRQAYCGISSFGFGGTNAHVIIKGASDAARKELLPVLVPFDRERAKPLESYLRLEAQPDAPTVHSALDHTPSTDRSQQQPPPPQDRSIPVVSLENLGEIFDELFYELTNIREVLPHIELTEQGLDSLAAVELVTLLQDKLHIEIEPELILEFPLRDEFLEEIHSLTREPAAQAQLG